MENKVVNAEVTDRRILTLEFNCPERTYIREFIYLSLGRVPKKKRQRNKVFKKLLWEALESQIKEQLNG